MAKRLILHVGLPKCGSTSMQEALARSTEVLAANDVTFVRLRPIKRIEMLARGERPELWAEVIGEVPTDTVILSSEFLCTLSPAGIEGLLTGLGEQFDSVTVAFVLRPLEAWAMSRMNQHAQQLPARPPAGKVKTRERKPDPGLVGMEVGDPDVWLTVWSAWVAERPQERDLLLLPLAGDRPLAQRFLAAVGLDHVELDPSVIDVWVNRSVSYRALDLIEVVHEFADLISTRQGLDTIRDDHEAFQYVKRIIGLAKQWDRPDDEVPSPEQVRAANKAAGRIRLGLESQLEEPLLGQVLELVGTRAASRRMRKQVESPNAATETAADVPAGS